MSKTARSTSAEWRSGPQRIRFQSLCKIYEVGPVRCPRCIGYGRPRITALSRHPAS